MWRRVLQLLKGDSEFLSPPPTPPRVQDEGCRFTFSFLSPQNMMGGDMMRTRCKCEREFLICENWLGRNTVHPLRSKQIWIQNKSTFGQLQSENDGNTRFSVLSMWSEHQPLFAFNLFVCWFFVLTPVVAFSDCNRPSKIIFSSVRIRNAHHQGIFIWFQKNFCRHRIFQLRAQGFSVRLKPDRCLAVVRKQNSRQHFWTSDTLTQVPLSIGSKYYRIILQVKLTRILGRRTTFNRGFFQN